jgi:hypothetical protein
MGQAISFIIGLYIGHALFSFGLRIFWAFKYGNDDDFRLNVVDRTYFLVTYTTPAYVFKAFANWNERKAEKVKEDKEINDYLTNDLKGDN